MTLDCRYYIWAYLLILVSGIKAAAIPTIPAVILKTT